VVCQNNEPHTHGPGFSFGLVRDSGTRQTRRARKWLDPAAPFFADHFPGNPLMPGVLLIECAAKRPACCGGNLPSVSCSRGQFRFRKPVLPGQTLEIDVTLEKEMGAFRAIDPCCASAKQWSLKAN